MSQTISVGCISCINKYMSDLLVLTDPHTLLIKPGYRSQMARLADDDAADFDAGGGDDDT